MTSRVAARLLATLALAAGAASALPPPLPPAQPVQPQARLTAGELAFPVKQIDLGSYFDTESPKGEFTFKNVGAEPVEILEVKPSCGCTIATLDKKVYQPGEEGVIPFSFDPKGRQGPQTKTISVRTNGRLGTVQTLTITSFVKPIVAVEPAVLTFGTVFKGTEAVQLVRVIGRTSDFEATNPTLDNPAIASVKILGTKSLERDGEQLRETTLEVTLAKGLKPGLHSTAMYVRTNDDRRPMLTVNMVGEVKGDLEVEPARLSLGLVRVGEEISRELRVRHRSGQAFEITNAAFTAPVLPLELTATPVDPAKKDEWVIRLSGKASQVAPRLQAAITFSTDVAGEEAVTIPVGAAIRN